MTPALFLSRQFALYQGVGICSRASILWLRRISRKTVLLTPILPPELASQGIDRDGRKAGAAASEGTWEDDRGALADDNELAGLFGVLGLDAYQHDQLVAKDEGEEASHRPIKSASRESPRTLARSTDGR